MVYEADAVLEGNDIEHVPSDRACGVLRDGKVFDTEALAELSAGETAQLAAVQAELRAAAQPEIDRVRVAVQQKRAGKLITSGVVSTEAHKRASTSIGSHRLDSATVVHLDDGRAPTVLDILRNPSSYDGATGADPVEPDYGGGRNKAKWFVRAGRVSCHSQAHGGQTFDAGWSAGELIKAWSARRDSDEMAGMWLNVLLDDPAGDGTALATAGVPTWAGLDFGLDALADLPRLVAQSKWPTLNGLKQSLRGLFDDKLAGLVSLDLVDGATVAAGMAQAPATFASAVPVPSYGFIPWFDRIKRTRNGPLPTMANAVLALGEGCGLEQHLQWDNATKTMVLTGAPPGSAVAGLLGLKSVVPAYTDPITGSLVYQWADTMLTAARMHLEKSDASITSKHTARDAINALAQRNTFSSVAAYLRGVTWDSIQRLDGWLVRNAGADDTPFNTVILGMWMVGTVARALVPEERGVAAQMDTVLTLVGRQAARKSTFIRELCAVPNWHTENSLGDLANKDAVLRINSAWIVDMAEGGSVRANEVEAFKQFVTTTADSIRLPYASTVTRLVRRNVFAMTVNPDGAGFLKDGTGNRRFWLVKVEHMDVAQLKRDRDQLWAEAVARFDTGRKWWFDKHDPRDVALEDEAAAAAEDHRAQTPTEVAIRRYMTDAPVLDQRGRVSWTPRPIPLCAMSALADVLGDVGQDGRNTGVLRDAQRAMTTVRWESKKVRFRSGPVARDQTVWVGPTGVAALRTDRRNKGTTTAFKMWLEEQDKAGAVGLPTPSDHDTAAAFTAEGDRATP